MGMSGASGDTVKTLLIDLAGFAAFGALFQWEAGAAERRIEERSQVWFCSQNACQSSLLLTTCRYIRWDSNHCRYSDNHCDLNY